MLTLKFHNAKQISQYVDGNIDKWVKPGMTLETNDLPGICHALTETSLTVIDASVAKTNEPMFVRISKYEKPKSAHNTAGKEGQKQAAPPPPAAPAPGPAATDVAPVDGNSGPAAPAAAAEAGPDASAST